MKTAVFVGLLCLIGLSQQAEWSVVKDRIMTIALGVTVPAEDAIYVSGANDGTGAAILKSEDGGVNWRSLPIDFNMMYMDISMSSTTSGVAGGIGMFQFIACGAYTEDGEYWPNTPDLLFVAASQNVFSFDNNTHFQVGAWQQNVATPYEDGVMATFDGYQSVEYLGWGIEQPARYGAFPTQNTWYLTGGGWPASERNSVNSYFNLKTPNYGRGNSFEFNRKLKGEMTEEELRSYRGVIAKTTNRGRTWELIYEDYGRFYFNGIACTNETSCWAVAEGPEGGWIMVTHDGRTWEEQVFVPNAGFFQVSFKGSTGWAVGAEFVGVTFDALFYHTTDGGQSWHKTGTIPNAYPNDVDVVSDDLAYATAFLRNGLSSVLVYN